MLTQPTGSSRARAAGEVLLRECTRHPGGERECQLCREGSNFGQRVAIRAASQERVRDREEVRDRRAIERCNTHIAQPQVAKPDARRSPGHIANPTDNFPPIQFEIVSRLNIDGDFGYSNRSLGGKNENLVFR